MRTRLILGVIILCAGGCAATALTSAGSRVGTGKAPPHEGCRELGIVMGSGGGGGYTSSEHKMQSAQNEIRNRAAAKGGDFVVLDTAGGDVRGITLSGRAFDCSAAPPAAPPVSVVVQNASLPASQAAPQPATPSVEERLRKLDELQQKGLITDEERTRRREEILKEI